LARRTADDRSVEWICFKNELPAVREAHANGHLAGGIDRYRVRCEVRDASGWLVTPARRPGPATSTTAPPLPVKTPLPPARSVAWNATIPASFTEAAYGAKPLNRSPVVAITVGENGRSPGMGWVRRYLGARSLPAPNCASVRECPLFSL
jgi:hypothetical protein